jgi:hypothetical protein
MIRKADMMDPMLEACPAFRPAWDAFLKEWSLESDLPVYLALSDLAGHLIAALAARDDETLRRAFAVVERWHLEGDEYVREAATVGFLEDLQNANLHVSTNPIELEPFLLPNSLKFWRKVDRFWKKGEIITDD